MRDDHQHDLAPVLSSYLNEHLVRDRGLSQLTRASYAHTFILLIRFIAEATRMNIDRLHLEDITAEIVLQFLDDLEKTRKNSRRTRNLRLAAIRSFFRYVQMKIPAAMEQAARIRALGAKRADVPVIDWLSTDEVKAILGVPDMRHKDGIRDRAMLSITYICGLRVSALGRRVRANSRLQFSPTPCFSDAARQDWNAMQTVQPTINGCEALTQLVAQFSICRGDR